jgi:putative redox protein
VPDRNVEVSIDFTAPAYAAAIAVGPHRLPADEPTESGGGDSGPAPTQLLLSALGACTSITLRMYAERKQWPVKSVRVELSYAERSPGKTVIARKVHVEGDLTGEQRERLLQIANACPVHKILTGTIEIPTELD